MSEASKTHTYQRGVSDAAKHVGTFGVLAALSLADFERRHKAGSPQYVAGLVAAMVGVALGAES